MHYSTSELLPQTVGILYDSVLEAAQDREITSWHNSLIDRHLKYLFNNALNLGTYAAHLLHNMKSPLKINIISKKTADLFRSRLRCAAQETQGLLKKPIQKP